MNCARFLTLLAALSTACAMQAQVSDEEFVGPFASWSNLVKDYGKDGADIQRALDEIGQKGHPSTLFLPAGTYCVPQLEFATRIGVSIIGENPDTTILKYCGAPDGVLIHVNGIAYSRFSRLTFDCAGVAQIGVDQSYDGVKGYFDTGNEYSDVSFRNCATAIRGGNLHHGFAETSVLRAHFGPSTGPCVILKNFNALDLWIWYSNFDRCNVGVTNDPGAGNFSVYNSIFRHSVKADMAINNTGVFNARNNTSVGSKAFWVTSRAFAYPAEMTLAGNTLIDVNSPAIVIGNQGPALITDNRIRSNGPAVAADDLKDSDLLTAGNTFSVKNPVAAKGRYIAFDDRIAPLRDLKEPVLPGTPQNLHRRVFEVPKGAAAAQIQQVVNAAAASGESRPIIHIPEGIYWIDTTIRVPRGSDLQIVGDGYQVTRLNWQGPGAGPVFRVLGPSKMLFREVWVIGSKSAEAIVIEGIDQVGSRVFMEQVQLGQTTSAGLFVDGLDYTYGDLRDIGHASVAGGAAIKVVGGRSPHGGRTNIFSGASSNNVLSYDLSNGGRLLVRDIWYETGQTGAYAHLTGSGTFTLQGSRVALPTLRTPAAAELTDFHGSATFLTSGFDDRIILSGDTSKARVLAYGLLSRLGVSNSILKASGTHAVLLNSRDQIAGGSSVPVANQGTADPAFLREMLSQTRAEQPAVIGKLPPGVSDVRLYRVAVGSATVGIHLLP